MTRTHCTAQGHTPHYVITYMEKNPQTLYVLIEVRLVMVEGKKNTHKTVIHLYTPIQLMR